VKRFHILAVLAYSVVTLTGCGSTAQSPASPTAVAVSPSTSTSCTTALTPATQNVPVSGGAFYTKVTSPCPWNASTSVEWISVTFGQGTGIGSVTYDVSANPTATSRTGELRIGDQTLRVTQVAPECGVSVQPGSQKVAAAGGAFDISVATTHPSCPWSASVSAPWVTLSASNGTGPGTIRVNVSANTTFDSRGTGIIVGERTIALVQAAAEEPSAPPAPSPQPQPPPPSPQCSYSLDPGSLRFGAGGGSGSFSVRTGSGCQWSASPGDKWIALKTTSGAGTGTVYFAVESNPGSFRQARIDVGGSSVVISQDAAVVVEIVVCPLSVDPVSRTVGLSGSQGMEFSVTATVGCSWKADTSASWITVLRGEGTGSGYGVFTVAPNRGSSRTATISVGQRSMEIKQLGYDLFTTTGAE
jgi:hypothetical protein